MMHHIIFTATKAKSYKIALLIKESAFKKTSLQQFYLNPLQERGINVSDITALSLTYNKNNKAPVKLIKESLESVLKACKSFGVKILLVADANYFKVLTKERKAEPHYGYIKSCKIEGYEDFSVILTVNYQALMYNPNLENQLKLSLTTLADYAQNNHRDLGTGIIHSAHYPKSRQEIEETLHALHQFPALTCDVEKVGLGLGPLSTIAFAWNKHNGTAFATPEVLGQLKEFFDSYQGTLIFHNATFDVKQLIFNLYMQLTIDNYSGVIQGLQTFFRKLHDTKILTYLATNNAAENKLSLKHNAHPFAGNYGLDDEEVKDISRLPLPEVLEYNLVDCLSTWYVFETMYPRVDLDNQLDLYYQLMLPSLRVITNMELVGLPLNMDEVHKARGVLEEITTHQYDFITEHPLTREWAWNRQVANFIAKNAALKTKINPIEDFEEPLNPGSPQQLQDFLYNFLGLDVIDTTDTGQPATGKKTLEKLKNQLISEFNITEDELC